jgi:septal ring factor EnvC (AmiA/AmiB activator)
LAWQSYGDATKQVIATTAPELGWSPEAKQTIAQKMQQLEVDIVAVRQTMEQRLAAQQQTVEQLAARQDQMASEITKLQATDQEILEKIQRLLCRFAKPPSVINTRAAFPSPQKSSDKPSHKAPVFGEKAGIKQLSEISASDDLKRTRRVRAPAFVCLYRRWCRLLCLE